MTTTLSMQKNTPPIRLSDPDKAGLLETLEIELTQCGGGQVWLFGSRTDLTTKGGDIDLYIELNQPIKNKLTFTIQLSIALEKKLGERKIDLVIKAPNTPDSVLHQIAKQRGILLWQSETP